MFDRAILLVTVYLLNYSFAQFADGAGSYAAFMGQAASPSNSLGADGLTLGKENPEESARKPLAPMAPPRVPILPESSGPSLSYRPPPPKLRRESESMGNCSFDVSKWSVEPASAISGAIMFDRETGLSCDECLEKCASEKYQKPSNPWVCRSLTYDHKWKICDLFAVNGTEYPYFLIEYESRDYFTFLAALPPSDAELTGENGDTADAGGPEGETVPETAPAEATEGQHGAAPGEGEKEVQAGGATAVPSGGEAPSVGVAEESSQVASNSVRGSGQEAPAPAAPAPLEAPAMSATEGAPKEQPSTASSGGSLTSHEGGYQKVKAFAAKTNEKPISIIPVGPMSKEKSKSAETQKSDEPKTSDDLLSLLDGLDGVTPEPSKAAPAKEGGEGEKKVEQESIDEQFARRNSINNACGDDEVSRYLEFVDTERTETLTDTEYADASNRKQCLDYCDDEGVISCASAMFSPAGCELSLSRANYYASDSFRDSPNVTYVEKVCVPKNFARGTKKVFGSVLNHILVGQVLEVSDAKTLRECVLSCLKAEQQFGFVCRSAMWYPNDDDQNCLLNTESRITTPDVFMPEDQGVNVVYFEIPRAVDESIKEKSINIRFRDSPISSKKVESKWTRWTMCKKDDLNAQRHRYLKCTDKKDIRKCPKESVMCRHPSMLKIQKLGKMTSASAEKTECIAIRNSNGEKRCPHGLRIRSDGKKEYCSKPVDC